MSDSAFPISLRLKHSRVVRGFTLIELMMVVAVLAVLTVIAVPAYLEHIDRSRRVDAMNALFAISERLETCYGETRRFNSIGCTPGLPMDSTEGHYALTGTVTADTYSLVATPVGSQLSRDGKRCATMGLDHMGRRSATGTLGDRCWR
jgi:type IV pilus assembly protein PilE